MLDTLFHALVRYAAPVLVFTSEEVWGTRFPEAGRCICWSGRWLMPSGKLPEPMILVQHGNVCVQFDPLLLQAWNHCVETR